MCDTSAGRLFRYNIDLIHLPSPSPRHSCVVKVYVPHGVRHPLPDTIVIYYLNIVFMKEVEGEYIGAGIALHCI